MIFTLICLTCKVDYEGYYNNQPCVCGESENIRWILKEEYKGRVENPGDCTIENMRIKIECKVVVT